ncbi:MAG TPA: RNA 2',3'-cyclic phosphodiesterase [Solirubrobacteraceae bacterium]|nr:RNA 2',3'-cyclic phosphodiesterase [Solirubrobacteraceae bacterium]
MSPRAATARLFAAVDPPPPVREQLAAWAREVSGAMRAQAGPAQEAKLRLPAPETMHVTLCFLGARPVAEIDALAAALEQCEIPEAGELSLGAPLWLPPRNPRSLALEIGDGDGWLERLQRAIVEAFAGAIAWEPDRRRFRAHVTVARIGRGKPSRSSSSGRAGGPGGRRARAGRAGGGEEADARRPFLPPTPQLSFTPGAVVLYRSWLEPQGASYEALATRELAD